MIDHALLILTFLGVLGTGLIGGLFFAFSTFIMAALGRISPPAGISAMQSINAVIPNPWFLTAFFGTAVACLILGIAAIVNMHETAALYRFAASVIYIVGVIAVTMVRNVPLNNALAVVGPASTEGVGVWNHYLKTWTRWNHVRTAASLAAAALFTIAVSVGS